MISEEQIIKQLHKNECPLCNKKFMAATRVTGRFYVNCCYCQNRWEISEKCFDEKVRVKDTISYKNEHEWKL